MENYSKRMLQQSPVSVTILQIMPLLSEILCVLSWFLVFLTWLCQSDLSPRWTNEKSKSATDDISPARERVILFQCVVCNIHNDEHHAVWFKIGKQCEMQCCRYVLVECIVRSRAHTIFIPYMYRTNIHVPHTHTAREMMFGWFKATTVSFHAFSQLSDIVLKRRTWR